MLAAEWEGKQGREEDFVGFDWLEEEGGIDSLLDLLMGAENKEREKRRGGAVLCPDGLREGSCSRISEEVLMTREERTR